MRIPMTDIVNAVIERAEQELGIRSYGADGWSKQRFLNPHNPSDTNPSAAINGKTGFINDFGGGTHSAIETAKLWGIPTETNGNGSFALTVPAIPIPTPETKEDFARLRGTTWEAYVKAGWRVSVLNARPAFEFTTDNGKRYRFTDGLRPRFKNRWDQGNPYKTCFYGLEKAIAMNLGYLIMVNGESSTVPAQDNGLPAFCMTTSGEKGIPSELLKQLHQLYDGQIYIALDCDQTGREASVKIKTQLDENEIQGSIVIDLGIDGKDMGDFCYLHRGHVVKEFKKLAKSIKDAANVDDGYSRQSDVIRDWLDYQAGGLTLVMNEPSIIDWPFKSMHQYGGVFRAISAKTNVAIVANSGGGKTSMMLSIIDAFRRGQKLNVAYRGKEFTELNYWEMLIQQHWGVPVLAWQQDRRAIQEAELGISFHERRGEYFEDYKKRMDKLGHGKLVSKWRVGDIMQWAKGIIENSGEFHLFNPAISVSALLDQISNRMTLEAAKGRPISVFMLDYLQRELKGKTEGQTPDQFNMAQIDEFCNEHNLVTFVGSQMTKDEANSNINSGRMGNAQSIKYASPDVFKGILNLHIEQKKDEDGNPIPAPQRDPHTGEIRNDRVFISKNNAGRKGIHLMTFIDSRRKWTERKD